MRKIISIFIVILCLSRTTAFAEPMVSAKSAVVMEEKSGTVLLNKDMNTHRPMASTTKIMTALTVLKNQKDLNKKLKIPLAATKTEGSSMYLKEGEDLTLFELLNGLLLVSGNDAANALAIGTGGSMDGFVQLMNNEVSRLGLKNTAFKNPSGLPNKEHYTTAYELALITKEAFQYEQFSNIVSTKNTRVTFQGTPNARYLKNHNRLLNDYEGCDGVKTGFTKEAGRCLVSSATKDGIRLIAVTLNAPNDWQDHTRMLDYAFTRVKKTQILTEQQENFTVNVIGGTKGILKLTNSAPLTIAEIDNHLTYERKIELPSFIYAPVKKGQKVGVIHIMKNGSLLARSDIIATEDIEVAPKERFLFKFRRIIKEIFNLIY